MLRKAYKFKLKTNSKIEKKLWSYAGHSRFIWNYFWSLNARRLQKRQSIMRYAEMDYWSKILKRSEQYSFLSEAPAHIIQQKLKDLDKAYQDGFDRTQSTKRLPKKRKKHLHSSFRFPDPKQFKIENRRISLPKIGWVSFFKSQNILGTLRNITISYHSGNWYISIQVESQLILPNSANKSDVGIDLGVAKLATLSNGKAYEAKNIYRSLETKLSKLQRRLSRKSKFSKNWFKQKRKIQCLHSHIANARKDHTHKITTEICKNHAKIFVEDLKVLNMSKSAKGTIENPGKNVRTKSGLNKSILDQGWSEFRRQLEYKSSWYGAEVVPINPQYTSQLCSECGHTSKENRQTQAQFVCVSCNFSSNADINAARNILAAGYAVSVCESNHISGRKQKPLGNCEKIPA